MAPLPSQQLDALHEASLKILADTGINVHSAKVREKLKASGGKVDGIRVRIPRQLVEHALSTAPSRIDVYNRQGSVAMVLEGANSYYGTGSDLKYTIDSATRQRRISTLKDVERAAICCDKLDNLDFVMSYGLPSDVLDEHSKEIEQIRIMLNATAKPLVMTMFSGLEAFERLHATACSACGGESNFRKAPNYVMYGQFVSPLQHDPDAIDRMLFCAEHGVPLIYVPTIIMGASGPVTLAGALALANAECLGGLVMHQLSVPGAPFIFGGCVSPLDMKTTVFSYGSPEWRLADAVLSQLSLRYNLPIFGTAGASDAKSLDIQMGAEWAYSLMTCSLAGTNLIHDVGYMESGMTGSLESLVISNEIVGMVKRVMKGFTISDETLALDMINGVGPAGHFMEKDHTFEHFRTDVWYPSIFERDRFEPWMANGEKDVITRASEKVQSLIKSM